MKVPKRIEKAIESRYLHQTRANELGVMIDDFLREHDIEVDEPFFMSGAGTVAEPWTTRNVVLEAIKNKETENDKE